MAVVISDTGLVTSWGGTANGLLINPGVSSNPSEFTLNMTAPEQDITPFTSGGLDTKSFLASLLSWEGTIKTFLYPAKLGSTGLVTFSGMPNSGGVALNVKSWNIELTADAFPSTAQAASAPTTNTYVPGLFSWKATASGYFDSAASAALIQVPGAAAAAITLKVAEDGASDPGFTGNCFATQVGLPVKVGNTMEYTYALQGSGALTATVGASTYATWWFAAAAVGKPAAGSLVLQAYTSRTFTGSAFWKSLRIAVDVASPVTMDIGFQGSGALTIA